MMYKLAIIYSFPHVLLPSEEASIYCIRLSTLVEKQLHLMHPGSLL